MCSPEERGTYNNRVIGMLPDLRVGIALGTRLGGEQSAQVVEPGVPGSFAAAP